MHQLQYRSEAIEETISSLGSLAGDMQSLSDELNAIARRLEDACPQEDFLAALYAQRKGIARLVDNTQRLRRGLRTVEETFEQAEREIRAEGEALNEVFETQARHAGPVVMSASQLAFASAPSTAWREPIKPIANLATGLIEPDWLSALLDEELAALGGL